MYGSDRAGDDVERTAFRKIEKKHKLYYENSKSTKNALTLDEQCTWIRESLTNFLQPPSRTNHNVIYGPMSNLFVAAKEGKVFVEEERSDNGLDSEPSASVSNEGSHRWKFYKEDIA
ncbi:hypothetical protein J1N35_043872 [Gossypium stocksii]|uniref:Uncharacterized protein n=1 Tax=Gossypium stocksii TaxID=47602 RepID=A0A9D3U8H1_9ROSI|nr:hypothetical protein J1N35_043872 [Gossypium stocksii]